MLEKPVDKNGLATFSPSLEDSTCTQYCVTHSLMFPFLEQCPGTRDDNLLLCVVNISWTSHCSIQTQIDCVDADTKSQYLGLPYMSQGIPPNYLSRLLPLIFVTWHLSISSCENQRICHHVTEGPFLDSPSVRDSQSADITQSFLVSTYPGPGPHSFHPKLLPSSLPLLISGEPGD